MNTQTVSQFRRKLIQALPQLLPRFQVRQVQESRAQGQRVADVAVTVVTPTGQRKVLHLDVRVSAVPSRVREALRQLKTLTQKQTQAYPVLAAPFLSPRVQEICRQEQVGYIDLAGNCYLELDGCYLEKIVEKNPFPVRGRPASFFTPISSRILRVMLQQPEESWLLGALAQTATVCLGQTHKVVQRLLAEEFARKENRRIRLHEPARLLQAWSEAYAATAHEATAYYSFERDVDQRMKRMAKLGAEKGLKYALTSFAAASLVAPFARGVDLLTAYVEPADSDAWVRGLDLKPVDAGPNVILRVPYDAGVFYQSHTADGIQVVGDVQLYLDLYSDPARGREQAEFLREKRLKL